MDEIFEIFMSWQVLLISVLVFSIMAFFNGVRLGQLEWKGVGFYLWGTKVRWIRKTLKFLEAVKVLLLPVIGALLALIPGIPRPDALSEESTLAVSLVFAVAGLCSMFLVKAVRKAAESRGIDIDVDEHPREQKRSKE